MLNKDLMSEKKKKKVLICHYRVGWTDGVSLEIEKRAQVLQESGWQIFLLAGPNSQGADFILDEMDFDLPEIRKITENAFSELKDYPDEESLINDIFIKSKILKDKIDKIIDKLKPDFLLLHNIFSHGRHIVCAKSFYDILSQRSIPSLATHHDFYWEREHLKNPIGPKISTYLNQYVPPVLPGLSHAVINSLSAKTLMDRTGIQADIIPDTLNFTISPWVKDEYNKDLIRDFNLNENDIFILQATRIVKRKGIELIPPIIHRLNSDKYMNQLRGKKLYNGKLILNNSKFVFLLAGYAEDEAIPYMESLIKQMDELKISYSFLEALIAAERRSDEGITKYSLFDTYPFSDLISYPSQVEGWGNQFLESIFARKPIMVFEYPVFKEDIKNKGYKYISLGDKVLKDENSELISLEPEIIENICQKIVDTLLSENTLDDLNFNFKLAEENNSHRILSDLMKWSMKHYEK